MNKQPPLLPKTIKRLLHLRLSTRRAEVLDDLDTLYEQWVVQYGRRKAQRMCWQEALNICFFGLGETHFKWPQLGL
jgi:hypothetical protein